MPTAPVTSWGEALITSFAAALALFMGAIPRVIAFAVILIVGWIVASLLATVVAKVLRAVRFNDLARSSGLTQFVHSMGLNTDGSGLIADITKWFVRLIALVVAFDALGLPAVSQVLQQLLLWLPNLVVALVILVLAGLAANAVSSLVRGATSEAGFSNSGLLATVAKVAIWSFAIVVAINQLGIATTLVNTLFMGLVAAMALAFGLAFGLGGRETAARIVSSWYEQSGDTTRRLARAAESAASESHGVDGSDTGRLPRVRVEETPVLADEPAHAASAPMARPAPPMNPSDAPHPADRDGGLAWHRSVPPEDYGRPLRGTQND
jgi:hypothetical protein